MNISGRDGAVLLLSLLLAFSIWLIHNLSLRYTEFMQVSVEAESNIDGYSSRSSNRVNVSARCQTTGYNIIRSGLFSGKKETTVKFDPSVLHHKSGDMFYLTSGDLKEYAHLIFGENVKLEYFITDTLFFRFPYENHKKVPVYPVNIISYRPQYMAGGGLRLEPDSVTVYGEPHHLDNIDYIHTEAIKLQDLDAGVHGVAKLEKIKGVRLSDEEVRYSLPVSRFVEIPLTVSIQVRNVPPGKILMVYPSTADVVLRCSFPVSATLEDGVRFYIDYNDFASSLGGRCIARPSVLPDGVIGYVIRPKVFECVVKETE